MNTSAFIDGWVQRYEALVDVAESVFAPKRPPFVPRVSIWLPDSSHLPSRPLLDRSDTSDHGGRQSYWTSHRLQRHRSSSSKSALIDWAWKLDNRLSVRRV